MRYFLFFFFFQAEDGIRDYKVTGVQTCALPILPVEDGGLKITDPSNPFAANTIEDPLEIPAGAGLKDRKSTRLNSSHLVISYAVFCLKKKNRQIEDVSDLLTVAYDCVVSWS